MDANTALRSGDDPKPRDTSSYRASIFIRAHLFLGAVVWALTIWQWPWRWLLSGTPVLTYILWLGEATGYRVLAYIPLWTFVLLINLTYSVASTSWLLFGFFLPACYGGILVASLCQFETVANLARASLGSVLAQLHFVNDKIAFFNIPALEIDTEVGGLMVIRGLTFSLLNLSALAHGVEIGIKLTDDMELALQVDKVEVKFFRSIDVGDIFGNIKGGEYEMTFGTLADSTTPSPNASSFMVADTPLLLAARDGGKKVDRVSTKDKLTDGDAPVAVSASDAVASLTKISLDREKARTRYADALTQIDETSVISEARKTVEKSADAPDAETKTLDPSNVNDMRAAICSELHDRPSVPHPPSRSIKVTTLQNMSSPRMKKFMHRLPLLLRCLLNPLAYFHTIHFKSITVGGSGKWLKYLLHDLVFRDHNMRDAGVKNIERRLSAWLADANFVAEITDISAMAQVPLSTDFDITTQIRTNHIMMYRTLPAKVDLKQVLKLGGADASVTVPSFLLPHHEHVFPPEPTRKVLDKKAILAAAEDDMLQTLQREHSKEQTPRDETNLTFSAHARLPAIFDQEILNFIAGLVKATKMIEMDQGSAPDANQLVDDTEPDSDAESPKLQQKWRNTFRDLSKTFQNDFEKTMKRVAVDAVTNDRWIAKLVGKTVRKLEAAQGDIGYTGSVPIALAPYRLVAETEIKLLP